MRTSLTIVAVSTLAIWDVIVDGVRVDQVENYNGAEVTITRDHAFVAFLQVWSPDRTYEYRIRVNDGESKTARLKFGFLGGFRDAYNEPVKGNCYIATSVYGSYDCPQLWVLRRFRDEYLQEKYFGRFFIRGYYAISPKMVKRFGEAKWFNSYWKRILDRWVSSLIRKGFKSDAYQD